MIGFNTNNYFGQQLKTDWNGFRLLGMRRPKFIDLWNVDVDYLSKRTKDFPALGSEMGWYGTDLIRDSDGSVPRACAIPTSISPTITSVISTSGGFKDAGVDVLGTGPAIVTNGPAGAGKAGFQRSSDPPFQDRSEDGSTSATISDSFPKTTTTLFDELRLQLEVGYASDRNFIEEYYKRLFDTGIDQETLAYGHLAEGQPVRQHLDRGQPPELVYRHAVAAAGRLLPPGRFVLQQSVQLLHPLGAGLCHDPHRRHGE